IKINCNTRQNYQPTNASARLILEIDVGKLLAVTSRTTKQAGCSSTDQSGGRRRSTPEPKPFAFPFEPRSENRGVHGILKAVPHVCSTFVFDVHVELARV